MMRIMDGYTMLRKVRMDDRIKDTPVILCTGKVQEEFIEASQKLGVDDYITKPFETPDFLAKIEKILNKSS